MAMATGVTLRIRLADIAMLAKVRRPVVSMWRTRAAATARPFPSPAASINGHDTFDAAEVARWLNETGHGNNPTATDDLAAFATVAGASPRDDRAIFDAVTALLCLKAMSTRQLADLSRDDLLGLAEEHDPDDEYLYAELASADNRLTSLARYSDLLADAAFTPRAAFERLMADRFRSELRDHASVTVSPAALSLAARIAVDLTDREDIPAVYVDSTPGSSDLLLAVVTEHGDRSPAEIMTAQDGGTNARLVRRRLRVHDVYREGLQVDDDGAFGVTRAVTHVAQFPTPAAPRMADLQILGAIENIVLQMDNLQRGVVIAPASALSDRLTSPSADAVRSGMLRAGHVHAVVRLPRGLVPTKPRQALALWLLGPAGHDIPAYQRFTIVADLADVALTGDVVTDLVNDLGVATGTRAMAKTHAFRFTRFMPTRTLLTARRSLVETASAATGPAPTDPAALSVLIEQTRSAIEQTPGTALDLPLAVVTDDTGPAHPRPTTIAAMLDARRLRMVPGNRLDDADLETERGVPVIGVAELVGSSAVGARRIDRLVLTAGYDAARFTEPGDVVFCTSPRPAALVDRNGSSVVAYPARVLRIDATDPGGLLAEVLAADINAAPAHAREWGLWPVRLVFDHQRSAITQALDELRRASEATRRRLNDLDLLTTLITDGVTGGGLALHPNNAPTKGN